MSSPAVQHMIRIVVAIGCLVSVAVEAVAGVPSEKRQPTQDQAPLELNKPVSLGKGLAVEFKLTDLTEFGPELHVLFTNRGKTTTSYYVDLWPPGDDSVAGQCSRIPVSQRQIGLRSFSSYVSRYFVAGELIGGAWEHHVVVLPVRLSTKPCSIRLSVAVPWALADNAPSMFLRLPAAQEALIYPGRAGPPLAEDPKITLAHAVGHLLVPPNESPMFRIDILLRNADASGVVARSAITKLSCGGARTAWLGLDDRGAQLPARPQFGPYWIGGRDWGAFTYWVAARNGGATKSPCHLGVQVTVTDQGGRDHQLRALDIGF